MKKVGKYIKEADHDKNMVFFNARKKVNEHGNNKRKRVQHICTYRLASD